MLRLYLGYVRAVTCLEGQGIACAIAYVPNLSAARARALAASSSRFFGGALVSSDCRSREQILAMSAIAASKAASFALEGLLKPVIFLTNCRDAASISSRVTGGSKLKSVLMFL